jgi:uncharacterized protein (DUF2384 family)
MAKPAENIDFQAFLSQLQEGEGLYISPELYAQKLALDKQRLAELAHVHRNTVGRMPKSPQLQKYLRESIRVLAAATDLVGSASKAAFWFRNQPLSDFSYKTAEVLVSEGRAEDVLRYIDMLSAGSAG